MIKTRWLLVLLLSAACGRSNSGKTSNAPQPIDPTAANGLLPAALKDKIVFERRAIVVKNGRSTATYTLAAPKGWKQDMEGFGHLKADETGGFFSSLAFHANCDGMCTSKDWEKIANRVDFSPPPNFKILKDEKGDHRRTMISEETDNTKLVHVVTAWWTDGDKSYHECDAELDPAVKDAAPAFEKACSAVNIEGDE